jgi:hypothetical protein
MKIYKSACPNKPLPFLEEKNYVPLYIYCSDINLFGKIGFLYDTKVNLVFAYRKYTNMTVWSQYRNITDGRLLDFAYDFGVTVSILSVGLREAFTP